MFILGFGFFLFLIFSFISFLVYCDVRSQKEYKEFLSEIDLMLENLNKTKRKIENLENSKLETYLDKTHPGRLELTFDLKKYYVFESGKTWVEDRSPKIEPPKPTGRPASYIVDFDENGLPLLTDKEPHLGDIVYVRGSNNRYIVVEKSDGELGFENLTINLSPLLDKEVSRNLNKAIQKTFGTNSPSN